jgi:hypothetical protein
MSEPKRYRLLRDLPDCKAGAIYTATDDGNNYVCYDKISIPKCWCVSYSKEYVEDNHTWFELIEQPKAVANPWLSESSYGGEAKFIVSGPLPLHKYERIRKVIQQVLNGSEDQRFKLLEALADILSRVYYFNNFKIETANERVIAGILNDLKLFPCSESDIEKRDRYSELFLKYQKWGINSEDVVEDNGGMPLPKDYKVVENIGVQFKDGTVKPILPVTLERAMKVIDDYLNAGYKEQRSEVHQKAKQLYKDYYGIEYVNYNER